MKMRKKLAQSKLKFWKNLSTQMYNEGAAPGRVRKREVEEVSSLLWWLRGEGSVSLRNLCEVGDGEGSGNAHKSHPLVKRGRV